MALQVWLPLNGTLENKGLDHSYDIPDSVNHAAWDNDGKIGGKSLYPDTLKSGVLSYSKTLSNTLSYTLCAWIKNVDNTTTSSRFILWTGSDKGVGFGMLLNKKNLNNVICRVFELSIEITIGYNEWHHIAMTIDYEHLKFSAYLDGIFMESKTYVLKTISNKGLNIGWLRPSYYPFKGYINDVRVYDTCLSAKEVKEISKGLILHYKLDGNDIGNDISLPLRVPSGQPLYDTTIYTEDDGSKWLRIFHHNNPAGGLFSSSDSFEDYVHIDDNRWFDISYCHWLHSWEFIVKLKTKPSASEVKYRWIQDKNPYYATYEDVKPNKVTRISTTGYTNNTSYGGIYRYSNSSAAGHSYMVAANTNIGNWWGATGCYEVYSRGIPGYALNTVTTGYMDLYVRIDSLLSSIAYDSSGYCNHGSITGTLTTNSDSPRYTASTIFNGSSCINAGHDAKVKDAITVSVWAYMSTWTVNHRIISCTENGGWTFYAPSSALQFYIGTGASSNTYKGAGTITAAQLSSGWHHFVGTYDGLNVKLYVDGVLNQSVTAYSTKTPIYYNASASIWVGAESKAPNTQTSPYFNGRISDIRVYATALSKDDIKELYNTSAFVTDNGVFAEYELYENNLSDVKKTGLLETANFYENGAESGYALDTDKTRVASNYIISEEFIEI